MFFYFDSKIDPRLKRGVLPGRITGPDRGQRLVSAERSTEPPLFILIRLPPLVSHQPLSRVEPGWHHSSQGQSQRGLQAFLTGFTQYLLRV